MIVFFDIIRNVFVCFFCFTSVFNMNKRTAIIKHWNRPPLKTAFHTFLTVNSRARNRLSFELDHWMSLPMHTTSTFSTSSIVVLDSLRIKGLLPFSTSSNLNHVLKKSSFFPLSNDIQWWEKIFLFIYFPSDIVRSYV